MDCRIAASKLEIGYVGKILDWIWYAVKKQVSTNLMEWRSLPFLQITWKGKEKSLKVTKIDKMMRIEIEWEESIKCGRNTTHHQL